MRGAVGRSRARRPRAGGPRGRHPYVAGMRPGVLPRVCMSAPTRPRADAEPVEARGPLARVFAALIARALARAPRLRPAAAAGRVLRGQGRAGQLPRSADRRDRSRLRRHARLRAGVRRRRVRAAPRRGRRPARARGRDPVDAIERALAGIPHVAANSALSIFRRARAGFDADAREPRRLSRVRHRHRPLPQAGLGRRPLPRHRPDPRRPWHRRAPRGARRHRQGDPRLPRAPRALREADQARPALRQRLPRRDAAGAWQYFVLFVVFVVVLNLVLYRSAATLAGVPDHARRLPRGLGRLHRAHAAARSRSSRRWCR